MINLNTVWIVDGSGILLFSYKKDEKPSQLLMGLLDGFCTFTKSVLQRRLTLINAEDIVIYFFECPYNIDTSFTTRHITVASEFFLTNSLPSKDQIKGIEMFCKELATSFLARFMELLQQNHRILNEFEEFHPMCHEILSSHGLVSV